MQKPVAKKYGPLEITKQDIVEAMRTIPGYIDVTPGDFKEVYLAAYDLAVKRLLKLLKASDLMTTPVFLVNQEMDLNSAATFLAEKSISGAPVIDVEGLIVGVVSERDFLKEMGFLTSPSFLQIFSHCLNNNPCMISKLKGRVIDVMTKPPITGSPEMTIDNIAAIFIDRQVNRLPIIDSHKRPIGIVTRTDLAHSCCIFRERS